MFTPVCNSSVRNVCSSDSSLVASKQEWCYEYPFNEGKSSNKVRSGVLHDVSR